VVFGGSEPVSRSDSCHRELILSPNLGFDRWGKSKKGLCDSMDTISNFCIEISVPFRNHSSYSSSRKLGNYSRRAQKKGIHVAGKVSQKLQKCVNLEEETKQMVNKNQRSLPD